MRGEFQVLHAGSQWDDRCNDIARGFAGGTPAGPMPGGGGERLELSEWVEQVMIRHLWEDSPETSDRPPPEFCSAENGNGEWWQRKLQCSNWIQPRWENDGGMSLLILLLECAVAVSVDNLPEANRMLLQLTQVASPYGASCAERVVAYFAKAMASRVMSVWLGGCGPPLTSAMTLTQQRSVFAAFQAFNGVSPFVKFAHFTANQAILEAFQGRDRVHIVDVDIMQGLQWPALFHILATRADGPPRIRMTGFGASKEALQETGRQLASFARRLGLAFEFHPAAGKFGDAAVEARLGEAVAVHWAQHSLYDAAGPDWGAMRALERLRPRVVTLVEQEVAGRSGAFLDRFVGALHYYSTLFDAVGAARAADDVERHRVEEGLLSREIQNILAVGDRFGRSWRVELAARGFMQVAMSCNAAAQAQLIVNMFPPSHGGYSLLQADGTLRFGWNETTLCTASAWTSPPLWQQPGGVFCQGIPVNPL